MYKNIAIITKGTLPIPAIRGGAVESLIDLIINENEVEQKYIFFIYSIYDKDANNKSKNYNNTKFIFIKKDFLFKIKKIIRFLFNKYISFYIGNQFISEVIKNIKKNNPKIDLILIENSPEYSIILKKKFNINIIQHLHNNILNKFTKHNIEIINTSDLIISVSNFINKNIPIYDKINKNVVCYNGIDLNKFNKNYSDIELSKLKKSLDINDNDQVIIFTGRIQPHKGIKELLLAYQKMPYNKNLVLLIIGASFFSEEKKTNFIKELYNLKLEIKNKIIFTGHISYEEIPKYYKLATIAVIPSIWEEPFGLTCLEAMACELAIITTKSGGMLELIDDNINGLQVEINDKLVDNLHSKINLLLNDEKLRKNLSKKAKEKSKLFSKDIYYERLTNFLDINIKN